MMIKPKVLVLGGGHSTERAVSLRSAANVASELKWAGYPVTVADPADVGFDLEKTVQCTDIVLPILHGRGGEDGILQAKLERLGAKYLGSDSTACKLTFDKAAYRDFVRSYHIRVAEGGLVDRPTFDTSSLRNRPYVLKPFDGGSSVDTLLVRLSADEPSEAELDALFQRNGDRLLMEELVEGTEITVGILGDKALPVIQIIPPAGETFDYENKYNGRTQEVVDPPDIDPAVKRAAQELALRIHRLCGCRHLSRTDMVIDAHGNIFVLETNTIPGMTSQSLLPKAAAAAGLDMPKLCQQFIAMAAELPEA